ncbi:MAG: flagellar hook-associated protein FlgL [Planctomycetota bacterium]
MCRPPTLGVCVKHDSDPKARATMSSITGISSARISSQFVRDQLIRQFSFSQADMFRLETEISTGQQYQLPSENPTSALQVMGIQSLLQRKDQLKTNIGTSQTYLNQSDSALTSVSGILTSIRAAAVGAVGATASDGQRQAVVQQIDQAVQQLLTLGNQQINGRQLFGGTSTATSPFSMDAQGNVVYSGSSNPVQSYVDLNQLFATSVTGDQAFGAISLPIQGSALATALSQDTRLSDLNGGQGVAPGSITVSDGHNTSTIDLRNANTLGDVATLIQQHPPTGRTIKVDVTSTGLTLHLKPDPIYPNGDDLKIQEVNGNTTAHDLGIFSTTGGPGPLVGLPLNAAVAPTTALTDLLATKAQAYVRLDQPNSDILLQSNTSGATTSGGTVLNGVTVQFYADATAAGQEWAYFYPGISASGNNPGTPGALQVHISTSAASASRAEQMVAAINKVAGLPFTAKLDPSDQDGGGQPSITTLPATTTTAGGGGTPLDTASGLQITSGGKTYTVDLSSAKTVQDLLNGINDSGAGLVAEINAAKTGIDVTSRVSGGDFSIGENGGTTATQLGLRTYTVATQLAQLNHGRGVGRNTATPGSGTDFTISETLNNPPGATVQVDVSIPTASSVNDVIQSINTAAQTAGATFRAQLVPTGNGIELVDSGTVTGPLVITANTQSTAAVDLGLIPAGQTSATSKATSVTAKGIAASNPNSDLVFVETDPATAGIVQIIFQTNAGIPPGIETANYDSVAGTLTFQIGPQTTANNIITALHSDPTASAAFNAWPDNSVDPTNNGSGIVLPQLVTTSNGWAATRPNSALLFQAVNPGTTGNVQVLFQANAGIPPGPETANYDPVAATLTFQISPLTTANNIITALHSDPTASAAFTAKLDISTDPTNNGNGIVLPQLITMTGGTTALTGSDTNPRETDSIFNALLRLSTALRTNDNAGIQRAMGLLDSSAQNLGNTRAELGAREQSLTLISSQIDSEELSLKTAMSANYDTNMADTISQYTSAQIAYQATLQTTGSLLKMTLLTYI